MNTPVQRARVRREIVFSVGLLFATLVVLTLALRGTFNSMWHFPKIFGAIMVVLAFVSLLQARWLLWKPRLVLAVTIVAISVVTPSLHVRAVSRIVEAYERRADEALRGKPAPPVPFVRSIGLGNGDAGSMRPGGKLMLLNFWATWCEPCVEELPMLERFWKEHRGAGVEVVGITKIYDGPDTDAEARLVTAFLDEHGVTYPVVIADEDSPAHEAYGVESLPSSILVDRDGSVVSFGAGILGTQRLMRRAEEMVRPPE